MSNAYFNFTDRFLSFTRVRADPVNAQFDAIQAAFELLPADPATLAAGSQTIGTENGTGNNYVVAMPTTRMSNASGDSVVFQATHTNTSTATLNVDGIGAVPIVTSEGIALAGGEILAGLWVSVRYDVLQSRFQMETTIRPFAVGDIPVSDVARRSQPNTFVSVNTFNAAVAFASAIAVVGAAAFAGTTTFTGPAVFTAGGAYGAQVVSTSPGLLFGETDASTGNQNSGVTVQNGSILYQLISDDRGTSAPYMVVDRNALVSTKIAMNTTQVSISGNLVAKTGVRSEGTFATDTGLTGPGIELQAYVAGNRLVSYNRTLAVYMPLDVDASAIALNAPVTTAGPVTTGGMLTVQNGRINVTGNQEGLRINFGNNAFVSFFNSAGTVRTGYISMNSAGASPAFINVEINNSLDIYTNNTLRLHIDNNGPVTSTGSMSAQGGLRATGANSLNWTGEGTEVSLQSGAAIILGYNRTANTFLPTRVIGASVSLEINSVPKLTINASGEAVTPNVSAAEVGYKGRPLIFLPQFTNAYTLQLSDAGKNIFVDVAGLVTLSIPTDAVVDFPIGTEIYVTSNDAAFTIVEPVTNGLQWMNGSLSYGNRTLGVGEARLYKCAANYWTISGFAIS